MALPAHHRQGTVTVTAGSVDVSGVNTNWIAGAVRNGDVFSALGLSISIASVESSTALKLNSPWPGATGTGVVYEIRYITDGARVLTAAREALQALEGGGSGDEDFLAIYAATRDGTPLP